MVASQRKSIHDSKSLRPPQFGLRTLLGIVAAFCVLLALGQWISPMAIGAIGFLAASIFCHVAGNAIGTRLRQIGDLPEPVAGGQPQHHTRRPPKPHEFAPGTALGRRANLGWMIIVATSIGVTTGAVGGGLWTFVAGHGRVGALNIAVGVIAFASLGGMVAFATFGFAQVLGGAIWQAISASSGRNEAKTGTE